MNNNTNYIRVENHTDIQFIHEETQLLSKGLKYNLHHKNKKWIEMLSFEVETSISNLDITEQNYFRHMVVRNIKEKWKQIINIKNKMVMNKGNNKSR
jgi:hypothetical protein